MYKFHTSKFKLIDHLKKSGVITSFDVERAMNAVDRKYYCPTTPYADSPVYIGYNSTISAPHMHAYCLEVLKDKLVKSNARALDIGCGSGYLTACMAYLMQQSNKGGITYGIDHIPELVDLSISNIKKGNPDILDSYAFLQVGDGYKGLPNEQLFDCIHIGAAVKSVPQCLVDQLAPDGKMVIPIEDPSTQDQWLTLVQKEPDGALSHQKLLPVRYVPLIKKEEV